MAALGLTLTAAATGSWSVAEHPYAAGGFEVALTGTERAFTAVHRIEVEQDRTLTRRAARRQAAAPGSDGYR